MVEGFWGGIVSISEYGMRVYAPFKMQRTKYGPYRSRRERSRMNQNRPRSLSGAKGRGPGEQNHSRILGPD